MKVKFGSIITAGRNKLGGHVYSVNRYGPFARTLVTPTNNTSSYTSFRRSNFAAIAAAWRTLADVTRAEWIAATADYPRTDAIGNTYFPSGFNLFCWLNLNFLTIGLSMITAPPTKTIPAPLPDFSIRVMNVSPHIELDFAANLDDVDSPIALYATRPLSPGINYVSTEYRLISVIVQVGQNNQDITAEYVNKYTTPVDGLKTFFKIAPIQGDCGYMGVSRAISGICPI